MGVAQTEDRRLRVLELWRLLELLSTQQVPRKGRTETSQVVDWTSDKPLPWDTVHAVWRDGGQPEGVGVEPRIDVARRVGTALERIASRTGEGRVVVVAHGSALTLGATLLLGLDPTAWFGLRGMDNCHYAVLRDSERAPGWLVRTWNKGDAAPVGE